jgi:hypothetical protein
MKRVAAIVLVTALPFAVSAHHSRVEFASDVREIEGEITQVMWFNTHPAFLLKVANDADGDEIWRIETFSTRPIYERAGG